MANTPISKKAIILGATGMVGNHVLQKLLAHEAYSKVIAFSRRPLSINHSKLDNPIIDFEKLADYAHLFRGDDIFLCLGTTMNKAGSKDAFKKVDFEYPLQVAQMAEANGVKQVLLCSAVDADSESLIFYNQVKGSLEDELKKMKFSTIQIFQPSLLLGERQEQRTAERISIKISHFLDPYIGKWLGKYRPVEAEKVASAMVENAQNDEVGVVVHASDKMKKY